MDEHPTGHDAGPGYVASPSSATRRPRPVRVIFAVLGTIFLAIAALGIVVPVLPTTPFVLLAAACYLRASATLHGRLLRSRAFGPTIAAWQEHRAIPPRAKAMAILMVTCTFAISIVFVVEHVLLQLGLAVFGAALVLWLARRPTLNQAAAPGAARPK
jgi:uncharacterized membrane protein YbaN (DUF454 family)